MSPILPIQNGLTWHPSFASPGEGPYTAFGKLASLNGIGHAALAARLLGGPPHGADRSFLWGGSRPIFRRDLTACTPLGRDFVSRSLFFQLGDFTSEIASDARMRYCPTCLATGFQSSLCQLKALRKCPAHGDELVDYCLSCGHPTPGYLLDDAFERPLHCSACGKPLSEAWDDDNAVIAWKKPDGADAYVELERVLGQIARVTLIGSDTFRNHREVPLPTNDALQTIMFGFAAKAMDLTIDWSCFDKRARDAAPLLMARQSMPGDLVRSETEGYRVSSVSNAATTAYLGVKSVLADRIGRDRIVAMARTINQVIRGDISDATLPLMHDEDVPALAAALFCAHFEWDTWSEFRADAWLCERDWMVGAEFSTIQWMRFFLDSYEAERVFAIEFLRFYGRRLLSTAHNANYKSIRRRFFYKPNCPPGVRVLSLARSPLGADSSYTHFALLNIWKQYRGIELPAWEE